MSEDDSTQRPGRVTVENVNHPGSTSSVDAGMYHAMRDALLAVLPTAAPAGASKGRNLAIVATPTGSGSRDGSSRTESGPCQA